MLYLGQTINTMIDPIQRGDAWKIKGLKKRNRQKNTYDISSSELPKNFLDLGIPIEEELFSMNLEEKKFVESIKKG